MKSIVLLIVFVMLSGHTFSQMNKYKSDSAFVDDFIVMYEKSGIDASIDFIYSSNKWAIKEHKTELQSIKTQLNEYVLNLGNYFGSVLIKKINLKDRYSGYSLLMRYERQPVRFILIFYKPNDYWQLQSFQYDSNLDSEITNSMNLSWEY